MERHKIKQDLKKLVYFRTDNIIMRAKMLKNGINEMQQNCLELLMKEQIALQEKLDLEEEIMRLQLQANLQDA